MPQPEKQLDVIKVTGLAANVERAKQGLLERVKELQAEQEDRVPTPPPPMRKPVFRPNSLMLVSFSGSAQL